MQRACTHVRMQRASSELIHAREPQQRAPRARERDVKYAIAWRCMSERYLGCILQYTTYLKVVADFELIRFQQQKLLSANCNAPCMRIHVLH